MGFADDRNPSISFNGHSLINEQNESNSSPRALDFYQSITQQESPWVVPGSNTVRVSSWNQEGNWSIYVYLRGEYKTAGECNHVLPTLPQQAQATVTTVIDLKREQNIENQAALQRCQKQRVCIPILREVSKNVWAKKAFLLSYVSAGRCTYTIEPSRPLVCRARYIRLSRSARGTTG